MSTRSIPGHVDSVGKLISRLTYVSKEQIFLGGKPITTDRDGVGKVELKPPDKVYVSPSVMRRFDCIAGCTACCLPFTLDYTPEEFDTLPWTDEIAKQATEQFRPREITVNGEKKTVYTYEQFRDPACPYLRPTREGGALGCGFWSADNSSQPLECAAAPQVLMTSRGVGVTMIQKRPFGRGWKWQNKPQCHFDPVLDKVSKIPDTFDLSNEIMLMRRYKHWADYLGVDTYLPEIIEVLEDFPQRLRDSGLASVLVVER